MRYIESGAAATATITIAELKEKYLKQNWGIRNMAVEEAIELHASKFNRHLGSHTERRNWARSHYSREVQVALDELFRIYRDLGYDGRNGAKAKRVN
jgi:hypothetical protein